ncbi:MAG: formylglycine-generating enzyme family protein [FCB group bacterium]|nr:formylglycine-generating enzyme family protein [FCB group bacterium]
MKKLFTSIPITLLLFVLSTIGCGGGGGNVFYEQPTPCDGIDCGANGSCSGGICICTPGYTGKLCEEQCKGVDMACIPAGCFNMGDAFSEGFSYELPVHEVCISAFEIDTHEITNAEYGACVGDNGCTVPYYSDSCSRATYYGDAAYDDYPVIWVDWYQVDEYCTWAGKRLPTEAEWEYAARGGLPIYPDTAYKRYPWGDTISSTDANYGMNIGDTTAVESYPSNGYGLYDMAGNVWEWTADWFDLGYYAVSPTNDPQGPISSPFGGRVMRGGPLVGFPSILRVANRNSDVPDFNHNSIGGRCVR